MTAVRSDEGGKFLPLIVEKHIGLFNYRSCKFKSEVASKLVSLMLRERRIGHRFGTVRALASK